jgi:hypothetical protein
MQLGEDHYGGCAGEEQDDCQRIFKRGPQLQTASNHDAEDIGEAEAVQKV